VACGGGGNAAVGADGDVLQVTVFDQALALIRLVQVNHHGFPLARSGDCGSLVPGEGGTAPGGGCDDSRRAHAQLRH
jgi:hypothetical protein